jgi:hypothetical protein
MSLTMSHRSSRELDLFGMHANSEVIAALGEARFTHKDRDLLSEQPGLSIESATREFLYPCAMMVMVIFLQTGVACCVTHRWTEGDLRAESV